MVAVAGAVADQTLTWKSRSRRVETSHGPPACEAVECPAPELHGREGKEARATDRVLPADDDDSGAVGGTRYEETWQSL